METVFSKKNLPMLIVNIATILVVAIMLLVNEVAARPSLSQTSQSLSNGVLSYQGTLTDQQGTALTGTYEMAFRIYPTMSGGTPLWTESRLGTNAVSVDNGLFSLMLGSLVPIPLSAWEQPQLYLGVQVGNDPEMTPREKLTFVPGANVAQVGLTVPDGSITDQKLGQDVNNYQIQTGNNYSDTYGIPEWTLDEGNGTRNYRTRITFDTVFPVIPSVIVTLNMIDIWSGLNSRLAVSAENITADGFDLVYRTWADTVVYGAGVSWFAFTLK